MLLCFCFSAFHMFQYGFPHVPVPGIYSETWELGTPKGLPKTVLNSKVVLFLRFISMYQIDLGTEVGVLNSQVVPISQVVLRTGFTVYIFAIYMLTGWYFVCSTLASIQCSLQFKTPPFNNSLHFKTGHQWYSKSYIFNTNIPPI